MYDSINGARLATKRIMSKCGVGNALAQEIAARAAGYRDWHHLTANVDKAGQPAAGDIKALAAYLAEKGVDTNVRVVMEEARPGGGHAYDERGERVITDREKQMVRDILADARAVGREPPAPPPPPMPKTEAELLREAIVPQCWGLKAVIEPGQPVDFHAITKPTDDEMSDAAEHAQTEDMVDVEIVARAAKQAVFGAGEDDERHPDAALLQYTLALHGRVAVFVIDEDMELVGASYAAPADGEAIEDAMTRLLERVRQAPDHDWDLTPHDIDGELVRWA